MYAKAPCAKELERRAAGLVDPVELANRPTATLARSAARPPPKADQGRGPVLAISQHRPQRAVGAAPEVAAVILKPRGPRTFHRPISAGTQRAAWSTPGKQPLLEPVGDHRCPSLLSTRVARAASPTTSRAFSCEYASSIATCQPYSVVELLAGQILPPAPTGCASRTAVAVTTHRQEVRLAFRSSHARSLVTGTAICWRMMSDVPAAHAARTGQRTCQGRPQPPPSRARDAPSPQDGATSRPRSLVRALTDRPRRGDDGLEEDRQTGRGRAAGPARDDARNAGPAASRGRERIRERTQKRDTGRRFRNRGNGRHAHARRSRAPCESIAKNSAPSRAIGAPRRRAASAGAPSRLRHTTPRALRAPSSRSERLPRQDATSREAANCKSGGEQHKSHLRTRQRRRNVGRRDAPPERQRAPGEGHPRPRLFIHSRAAQALSPSRGQPPQLASLSPVPAARVRVQLCRVASAWPVTRCA